MTQPVDGVSIRGDKSSNRCERLGEGTHDEVYLVGQSKVVTHTPTLFAEYTDAVGLVDHDGAVVLMLQLYNLRQFGEVTFHGEHAVNDDKLDGLIRQVLQHTLQVVHVIVLIVELLGKRKTTPYQPP